MLRLHLKFFTGYLAGLAVILLFVLVMASPIFGIKVTATLQGDNSWTATLAPSELPREFTITGQDVHMTGYACGSFEIAEISSHKLSSVERMGRCANAEIIETNFAKDTKATIRGNPHELLVSFVSSQPFEVEMEEKWGPSGTVAVSLGFMLFVGYTGVMLAHGSAMGIPWLKNYL